MKPIVQFYIYTHSNHIEKSFGKDIAIFLQKLWKNSLMG